MVAEITVRAVPLRVGVTRKSVLSWGNAGVLAGLLGGEPVRSSGQLDTKTAPVRVGSTRRGLTTHFDPITEGGGSMEPIESQERWCAIPGYDGNYEASSIGRVRSIDRTERVGKYTRRRKGRILKPANLDGYLFVGLRSLERIGRRPVHQLVAEAFFGPRPSPEFDCCHNNGIATDNRVENLRWDSKRENQRDRSRHGQVYVNRFTRRSRCKYGHPFGPEHTRIDKRRWRVCRVCAAARRLIDRQAMARGITYAEMAQVLTMPEAISRVEAKRAAPLNGGEAR